jgi:hypothetical protein
MKRLLFRIILKAMCRKTGKDGLKIGKAIKESVKSIPI